MDCARRGREKKFRKYFRDSTHVPVVHTSVRSPTTPLTHTVLATFIPSRGDPEGLAAMGEASGVLRIHFEFTQFALHTGTDGQPESKYLSLCPQMVVAPISHQITLLYNRWTPLQKTTTGQSTEGK